MRHRVLSAAALSLLVARGAFAMDFVPEPLTSDPTKTLIVASGDISVGDDAKLHAVVGNLPANTTLVGIALNSPGGNYVEGVRLATSIHNSHVKTAVMPNGICASACFLMFAGGDIRFLFEGARVGVHSASENGEDSIIAEGVTTLMARQARDLGVPAAIIGKMVTTLPDQIAWLTPTDLRSMNVSMLESSPLPQTGGYVPGSALTPGSSARPVAPPTQVASAVPRASYRYPNSVPQGYRPENATVATIAPATPTPSAAFMQGRSDRVTYQAWFDAQMGDLKLGAVWWAEHRSQASRQHLTCASGGGQSAQFMQGCTEAQALLSQADARRLSDPEYRTGWNSL